ncbi:hypothetical protein NERG_00344 [Nematocida ausubeli]|uniref:Phosphatidic acid phosphatase type 2/haloperoxidase domain-containing protein n=1 Tax=Nematocida ausubeli (strain ATCC PRA-371 / ERTm2) TaxID=1913371 RepID=H8Z9S3_NEMA1|nr:hypothetical protein NERG_00344 [Nematocida ausubeli]
MEFVINMDILDVISSEAPYGILVLLFIHGMLFCRSKKYPIPSSTAFFWKYFGCCIMSVLAKYPFNGDRPAVVKEYTIPKGWAESAPIPSLFSMSGIKAFPTHVNTQLKTQPSLDVFSIPQSLSQIKRRYLSNAGTPSSHSFVSGYLICKLWRTKYYALSAAVILIPVGRVLYKHHYVYQVLIGMVIGGAWGMAL